MNVTAMPSMETQRRVFVFIAALSCTLTALALHSRAADSGTPVWTNRYDGPGHSEDFNRAIAVDGGGNVFITGSAWSGTSRDIATVAYSGEGVPLWTNLYNGPANGYDETYAVVADRNGSIIVTGASEGIGSDFDYVTIKYSDAGVPLWTNRLNGPGNGDDESLAVMVDGSGNVFVTGYSPGSGGVSDYATIKYSTAGVPLWTNTYNGPANSHDYARALAVDGNGNVFVVGSSVNSDGNSDYATIKYSTAGVSLWTNTYNGPANRGDIAHLVAVDGNGNVFVSGSTDSNGNSDYATVAYSGMGVPLWTNTYNGPANNSDSASSLAVDGNGNVIVTGASGSDYATIKYLITGVPLWTNRFSDGFARGLAVDASGNIFVTGESGGQYVTVAYSGAGVPLWTNRFNGGSDGTRNKGIALDSSGNIFVTGSTASPRDYVTVKYTRFNSAPLVFNQVEAENGQLQLLFNAEFNRTYSVEFRDFMDYGNWLTLTNIPAQPTATNFTVTDAMTNAARFYRLRTP